MVALNTEFWGGLLYSHRHLQHSYLNLFLSFPDGSRIRRPMQETWVPSLTQEDPKCLRAAKLTCHSFCLCSRVWELQLLSQCAREPVLHNKKSHCNKKPAHYNEDTTKNKYMDKIKKERNLNK